jgi:hypothetical protein
MTNICTQSITSASTAQIATASGQTVGTGVSGFGNPQALTIQARFTYVASAATSVTAWVQTTIDGTNWIDIASFGFTTASSAVVVNVSGTSSITTPTAITDGSLASNTIQQGILGSSYRVKYTSVGTYGAGTVLTVDVQQH